MQDDDIVKSDDDSAVVATKKEHSEASLALKREVFGDSDETEEDADLFEDLV